MVSRIDVKISSILHHCSQVNMIFMYEYESDRPQIKYVFLGVEFPNLILLLISYDIICLLILLPGYLFCSLSYQDNNSVVYV